MRVKKIERVSTSLSLFGMVIGLFFAYRWWKKKKMAEQEKEVNVERHDELEDEVMHGTQMDEQHLGLGFRQDFAAQQANNPNLQAAQVFFFFFLQLFFDRYPIVR